jgi:Peptidase M1 N-terminal domain
MKWLKSGIILLLVVSAVTAAPVDLADDDDSLRLPQSSWPLSYDLTLTTNVHAGVRAFTGKVIISIEIKAATNFITLHNRGLTINDVKLKSNSGNELEIDHKSDAVKEFLVIESLTTPLQSGDQLTVEIEFNGLLQTGTSGFYRSSYVFEQVTR